MIQLNKIGYVTIALLLLEGDKKPIDTEDIAIKVAELAPEKFSWRKYKQFIDPEAVRISLKDAHYTYNYVVGSQKEGWMLSKLGLQFARDNVNKSWTKPSSRKPTKESLQMNREKERLLASDAYEYFTKHGKRGLKNIPKQFSDDFFRLNNYIRGQARIQKITRIENLYMDDVELKDVVRILAQISKGSN